MPGLRALQLVPDCHFQTYPRFISQQVMDDSINTRPCAGCADLVFARNVIEGQGPAQSWSTTFNDLERGAKAECVYCTILWKGATEIWGSHPEVFREDESVHDHRDCEETLEQHIYGAGLSIENRRLTITRVLFDNDTELSKVEEHHKYWREPPGSLQLERRVQIQFITREGTFSGFHDQ